MHKFSTVQEAEDDENTEGDDSFTDDGYLKNKKMFYVQGIVYNIP